MCACLKRKGAITTPWNVCLLFCVSKFESIYLSNYCRSGKYEQVAGYLPSLSAVCSGNRIVIVSVATRHLLPVMSDILSLDRLTGLVVKASALGAKDLGFESRLRREFCVLSHTSN